MDIIALPLEDQKKLRKGKRKLHAHADHKSRLRPDLRDILRQEKPTSPYEKKF
jgi:hypothetical protein